MGCCPALGQIPGTEQRYPKGCSELGVGTAAGICPIYTQEPHYKSLGAERVAVSHSLQPIRACPGQWESIHYSMAN